MAVGTNGGLGSWILLEFAEHSLYAMCSVTRRKERQMPVLQGKKEVVTERDVVQRVMWKGSVS